MATNEFHAVCARKLGRPPQVMLSPFRTWESFEEMDLAERLRDRNEPSMELETAKQSLNQLKFHSSVPATGGVEWIDIHRGSYALSYGPGVDIFHQKGAHDWSKAKLKFLKGNLFTRLAQQENKALQEAKAKEAKGQVVSQNDIIVLVNGTVLNQEALEDTYGIPHKEGLAEMLLAAFLKGYTRKTQAQSEAEGVDAPPEANPDPEPATFLRTMQGDWVVMIYDNKREYLFAARSRTSTNPLFWGTSFSSGSLMFSTNLRSIQTEASSGPSQGEFPRGCFYESHPVYEEAQKWTTDAGSNRRGNMTHFFKIGGEAVAFILKDGDGNETDDLKKNNLQLGFKAEDGTDVYTMKLENNLDLNI